MLIPIDFDHKRETCPSQRLLLLLALFFYRHQESLRLFGKLNFFGFLAIFRLDIFLLKICLLALLLSFSLHHLSVLLYNLDLIVRFDDLPELFEQALNSLLFHPVKWVILMVEHILSELIECPGSSLKLSEGCHALVENE